MRIIVTITALIGVACLGAEEVKTPKHHWRPVADDVYLQEVGSKIATDAPVLSVGINGDQVYVAFAEKVAALRDGALTDIAGLQKVRRFISAGDTLWALAETGLYELTDGAWRQVSAESIVDVCEHTGQVYAATAQNLFSISDATLTPINKEPAPRAILAIASYAGTIYCLHQNSVSLYDPAFYKTFDTENVLDWGAFNYPDSRDIQTLGSRLLIATNRGLGVLRGMALTTIAGEQGLPYEDPSCLREGFADDLWIGTPRGAIRWVNGEYHFFSIDRWLPNEQVNDIAVGDNVVYIATPTGLGVIHYEPYTLLKKAAYYERHLEEWGQKRLGFTHKLDWNSATGEWLREVSDNDVGFSTHYFAAMCFKYAVTGDESARAEATDFFNTMKWSEEITGIPGFPARSIWATNERGNKAQHGSGGLPAEWHATADGLWEWKGDTSSDETDAHFYAAPIFYELVAKGKDKERAKEHIQRLAAHIVDNGWVLKDFDGQPTRWGRWDPEYLHTMKGFYAQGLNGMEALAYMHTAYAITGDEKFQTGLQQLLDWGYLKEVVRQKLVFSPGFIFHSDDRLAFYTYYPLLKYTTDPALRSIYMRSLERSWEIERIEHNPWFNFIYGALTGNDCEEQQAVAHLREWPLDVIDYSFRNSHRSDLKTPQGYEMYSGGVRSFSPRETGPMRWSDSTLEIDGGGGGGIVVDPSGWLDAYWMGRYYGFIEAPTTKDPKLTTVEKRPGTHLGAKPYDGPPRPN